ncbi:MAG: hypothetical protein M1438_09580 [Deltaproteobacteria bacterium]|nr:hypothetical protein [Deltaproteobacteria bacterium]
MITPEILQEIVPSLDYNKAQEVADALNPAMDWADITTPERQAAFIAQCAHESDHFKTMREYASGRAYEGREDLGNTEPGDGPRFKGRGYIQITGRSNYTQAAQDLDLDLVDNPEIAETPEAAGYIAAWYWNSRNLNRYADAGDFRTITRRINGGYNGWADRVAFWERAKDALGVA